MTEHEIKIENFAFVPAELEIRAGDTVTWTNRDAGMAHTATSQVGAAEEFDTGDLGQDDSASHTFEGVSAGDEIAYVCRHHAFMQAKITVT